MKSLLWKRTLCCLLSMILILGNLPVFSFAEESDGLCEHHTFHTSECGYSPAIPGSPCTHEHTQDCYQTVAECIHVHDDSCGYSEEAGDSSCAHVCSEEYGCFKLVPDCRHAHDKSCGYVEAVPEQPCAYACTECAEPGEDPSEPEEDPSESEEDPSEPSEPEVDEAVEAVRALIEALPTLEEIKAMSTQEQAEVYTQVQKAYDAYDALTNDQKAQLPEAEGIFAPLFDYFNSLVTAIWDGAGSASSPYLINNEEDLRALAQSTYDGDTQANTYFALTGNITLTEAWTPIGTDATKFSGIFNGQGYTISGISGTGSYLGLFAYLGGGARVENVNVAAVDLSGGPYLAGIAAVADHTGGQIVIRNCHALSGTISGIDSDDTWVRYLAGIVGYGYANGGTSLVIEKCTNSVYINAKDNSDNSGGIAGYVNSATITSCINYAAVHGNAYSEENGSSNFGGICGQASGSTFAGCANYGAISTFFAHGIAGGSGNRFSNCLNGGTLTHSSDGYGVPIGRSLNSRFENCYFSKVGYQDGMLWEDPSKTGTKVGSLSGGDVAYLMGNYFGQVIGTDPYPVLLTASNKVHKVTITGELENTLYVTHNRQMSLTLEDPNLKLFLNDAEFSLSTPITEDLALTSKTVISVIASGECGNQGDNLTWQLTGDGVLTVAGTGAMSDYGSSDTPWVDYRDRIKSVVLESGVNQIGKYAFSDCSNLTDVTIPEGVTGIAAYAFNRCTGLKSISIPGTVTSIGDSAFYKCSNLTGLTIPEGVTHIGASAFRSCTSLADVTVANSVISIGSLAFADCTNLTGIALPGGLRTLGSNPFKGCTQITSFTISESNSSFCSVDGVLFNEACTRILAVPGGISGSYSIPDGVTSIDSYAFSGCSSLTGVTIPSGVTGIGSYAFSGCSSLTGVTILDGVKRIDSYAFSGCSSLTSIIIPSSVTSIYGYAFGDCGSLTSITFSGDAPTIYDPAFKNVTATVYYPADNSTWTGIPTAYGGTLTWKTYGTVASGTCGDNLTWVLTDYGVLIISGTGAMSDYESLNAPWYAYRSSIQKIAMNSGLTYIGARAFQNCSNLTDVTIPESVTGIGSFAFASCHSLTGITLPSELTTLGSNPFGNCNLLTSITIPETNASFRSVGGVLFNKACTEILSVPSGKSGSYSIPESVTGIGSNAFAGCKNLTDVIIPENVSSIATAAFQNCSGLTGITIPEGVTGIGQFVFDGCSGLTDITIPSSVTGIDRCAFSNCSSLTSITFSGDAPTIYYNAFSNVTATVYYPNGNTTWENVAGKSYSGSLTWETYGPASEVASGTCGEHLTWVLTSDGVLTINGTGDMYNYSSFSSTPWYSHASRITSLVVTEGVTSIGSNAFRGSNLESVSFGNASLTLGNYSFAYCESLTSIDFGTGTIQPGEYVFAGCTALTSVHVPQNVVMNGSYSGIGSGLGMFTSCSSLQTATVDCGYVGPFFFESCYGMTQATFTNPNVRFYYLENNDSHPFNAGSQAMNVNVMGCLCSQASVLVQKGQRSDITLTFSQIAGDTTQHTEKVLPGTATCTAAGLSEGKVCSVCGYVIEKQTNVDALGHDLQSHDGKAATCLKTGWEAYETCSRCDYTTYQEIPLADHTEKTVPGYAASCDKDGLTDGTVCSVCGAVLVEQKVIPAAHTLFKVEGKEATCTEDGVIAHYRCKVCGRKFADESAKTELSNTVIPAGHQFNENHQCKLCGKIGGEWGDQGTWELVDGCLTIQGAAMFDQLCPALDDAPWGIYSEDICEIVIGNNVGICENAFANLANLEAVTIAAIDGIRDNAFADCGKLNTITFTEEVPFAISQTAFTGVTATAHYEVEYNTWLYSNLQNYGGNLTWVEHGENAKRIAISHYGSSGGIGSFCVQTFPDTSTADCEFTLSKEGIIELTSTFFRGATYKELSPGEVTVTARDKRTGLTASITILVPDTKPKDIECPYEEEILIDGYIVRREYRFTPKTTGYYVSYNSYMGEAGGITVTQGDSQVERFSSQYVSGGEYGVYYLTSGVTYSICLECDSGLYGTNITFRWNAADTQITSIFFEEETLQFDLTPGTEGQFAWVRVRVTPGECSDPITWSIGDSDVAEIQGSDGYDCYLTLKNVGTTTLTASCGGRNASVPLVVHAPAELKLNQTAQVTAYENTSDRLIQFTADETAQYVFTVQGASSVYIDGQRQDPNGYGADGETYFAKVSAGQTLVLRLTLHEDTTASVSAAKAESAPQSMELICLSNTQHEVSFGVRFSPAASMEEIVSWEISDPDLLGESSFSGLNSSRKYYIPYAKGEVTVTATSASGLTASCTLTVGRCFDGHTNVPQVIAATCTTGGFTINTCSVCGEKTITARVNALGHDLTHHDAQAATCSEIGWEAYDTCSRCDYTTYEEIPATGHTLSHVNSTPASCTEAGVKAHYHCSVCGKDFEDENGATEMTDTSIPTKPHTLTKVDGSEPTCTDKGVKEHFHCSVCGKNFEDENGTTELADTSIPAKGHSLAKVDGSDPTCTDKGVKEHFHCSVCGKDFADENGTTEMTDTTIPTVEHEWGAWEVTTPATPEADGEETRKCASCQQEETRPLAYTGNRVELAGTGLENEQVVWIDGVAVPVEKDGSGNSYVTLPENSSSILVTYSFNTGSGDRHTQYPTGMKVYRVEKTDSGLTVAHLPELDNLLQYSGCSIRIVGVKGIRMITSISKSTRSALMGDGLAGYKLVEYGTAICRASALEGGAPMVLGTPGVKSNYAYKRDVADPIFKDTGSLIQYTNVLVGFTDEDCKEDIAMRPYITLEDENGDTVTLYGGIVYRSIGYIAYQNRNAFAPGSNAYNYVWNIIHYVYEDQYDADYKG